MDIEGYNKSKSWIVVVLFLVFFVVSVIWFQDLRPKINQANASRALIAQIDFWKIVAGEKPIPDSPEGKLATDIRIVYFEQSTPRQIFCALVRLTNRNYRDLVISVPIYVRMNGEDKLTFDLLYVNQEIARIIARQTVGKEENH